MQKDVEGNGMLKGRGRKTFWGGLNCNPVDPSFGTRIFHVWISNAIVVENVSIATNACLLPLSSSAMSSLISV